MQTKRVMGIEPTSVAWEANVLPLDDTRESRALYGVLGSLKMGIRLQFVISFSARPIMRRFAFSFLLALPILAFLGVLVVAPLAAMLGYQDAAPLWGEMLGDAYYQRRIVWTVFQAAATVVLTTVLGVPIAWALARLQFAGRALVLRLLMLPFILPTLVAGMGVLALFGEHGALWRGWAGTAALLLYGNVFFNLPVMIRAAYQGLATVPANRLAAAQTLGANAWQRFWRVELPVLKAWLAGGACLVFLYCFSGFGLALLLGGQRFATVEVEVYQLIAYELDMAHAAVLVWLVLGVTALAGLLYAWISRRADAAEVRIRQPEKPKTWAEHALLAFALFTLAVCCALPLLAIAFQAAQAGAAWRVLWDGDTLAALWNTARFSGGAVLGAAVLGALHAAAARQWAAIRAYFFAVYGVARVLVVWRVTAVSERGGELAHAACAVCLVGLSLCYQRYFIRLGRAACQLHRCRAGIWRQPFSGCLCGYAAAAAARPAPRLNAGRRHLHRRIRRHAVSVAPRMDHADHADLRLFKQSGRGKP